jgi:CcmD family protein
MTMTTTRAPTWKRIRTAVLALVVLASSAGVALAQQFEKVENLPRQEIPAGRFVAIAYGIIWLAILTYVVLVASGVKRVNQEIADLKRKVDRSGSKL